MGTFCPRNVSQESKTTLDAFDLGIICPWLKSMPKYISSQAFVISPALSIFQSELNFVQNLKIEKLFLTSKSVVL